jgi:GNAT superfamily N-acetyltransferase
MKTENKHAVVVRDATTDDIEFIADCNCRLAEETENKTLDRSILVSGLKRGMASPWLCRYFVAESGGRRVGTTMLTYELTDWRDGILWWLQSVYVLKDFRNLGVFRAVYHHVETLARASDDARGLRLYVLTDNARAISTYRAMGMSHSGFEVMEQEWAGDD